MANENRWVEVQPHTTRWEPKQGEELEGRYLGSRTFEAEKGPFEAHSIRQAGTGRAYSISGPVICTLFAASGARAGDEVRLVYTGLRDTEDGERRYHTFRLFTLWGSR